VPMYTRCQGFLWQIIALQYIVRKKNSYLWTYDLYGPVRKVFDRLGGSWTLEIEAYLGPEMATSEASVIWAQKRSWCSGVSAFTVDPAFAHVPSAGGDPAFANISGTPAVAAIITAAINVSVVATLVFFGLAPYCCGLALIASLLVLIFPICCYS
jgi:hypothetical protein